MKSLLFQGLTPFTEPPDCAAIPCRTEIPIFIKSKGRTYEFVLRDKVVPEDPYLILVKAIAFALYTGEPYNGTFPGRGVRDFLIKNSVVI
jgi:hypothetical protein